MKKSHIIDHFLLDNSDKEEFDETIELHCLILSDVCLQYFDSQHKAIWIDDTIFLKGKSQTILRIKRVSDTEYIDLDVQEGKYVLAPSGHCILNKLSPFYRCNYYEATLVGKDLHFPDQVQLSYEHKALVTDLSQLKYINDLEKGLSEVHMTYDQADPETFVDPGI